MKFNVSINPFTRTAVITNELSFSIEIQFKDIDEWHSFNVDDLLYDAHFLYDEKFSFNIYAVDENNHNDYSNCLVQNLNINL